jgi:replication factor C small subunit
MTKDAQQALRGTMEEFAENTSFILTCNYPHKVIEPITSRCGVYNFKPISKDQTMKLIAKIVSDENIEMDPEVGEIIAENARGDMRRVLHELEGLSKLRRRIVKKDVRSLPTNQVQIMTQTILKKEPGVFPKARDMIYK